MSGVSTTNPGYQPLNVDSTVKAAKSVAADNAPFRVHPEPRTWLVTRRSDEDFETVKAIDVMVKDGALMFLTAPLDYSCYPAFDLIYAPGTWRTVCLEASQ